MKIDPARYQLPKSTRQSENIEWTTSYIYNRNDLKSPRVLLIGDSICNGYHAVLRQKLADKASITFWASSYCVTDPAYLHLLDNVLDGPAADLVVFNNGLHSLTSDPDEWQEAAILAVKFILAKLPGTPVVILNSTPLKNSDPRVEQINAMTAVTAKECGLDLWDIFSLCDKFDRSLWTDNYHFHREAIDMQADFLAGKIIPLLPECGTAVKQTSTATGPDGALQ